MTAPKEFCLPARFCPLGQLGKPAQIAHICKSHIPAHRPKFAKECNFASTIKSKIHLNFLIAILNCCNFEKQSDSKEITIDLLNNAKFIFYINVTVI